MVTVRTSGKSWFLVCAAAVAVVAIALVFKPTFSYLYAHWHREEYSHGFMVPLISAFLLWQRRHQFAEVPFETSWMGVLVAVLGLLLYFLGTLGAATGLDPYSLVMVIAGCVLAFVGWRAFRIALVPIALLLLMNPLPTIIHNNLSAELQLLSSQIGVAVIRLFGISVFLEGNVIDLGVYKLQVAEACSGLRYLFPLMTIGVIMAYMFRGRTWMRWTVFLSTVPITILMNSFRIGVIGVLVDRYGVEQAEGFLHDFEGWVVFMACFALLLVECWLLHRLGGNRGSVRDAFSLETVPPSAVTRSAVSGHRLSRSALGATLAAVLAVFPALILADRTEVIPDRSDFGSFPLQLGEWNGRRDRLESIYLDELQLDDYLLADYVSPAVQSGTSKSGVVNLYAAYYQSQRNGKAVHSPRSCLPGGGWQIENFEQRALNHIDRNGSPVRINRAVIQQGENKQLVYYWFQQRGRNITNEYLVKWYMFVDSIKRNRTDGALVRLVTPIGKGEAITAGDARLVEFSKRALPIMSSYLPD
jgi:exosortase D (VPLPA-CTERM-specific)